MPYSLKTSFPLLKRNIIEQFESRKVLEKKQLDSLKKTKTLEQFQANIKSINIDIHSKMIDDRRQYKIINSYILNPTKKSDKLWNQIRCLRNKKYSDFLKVLTKKDRNPEVLSIKKELKEKYNVRSVYLNNNLEFAKNILESAKKLKNNNIPFPKNIIVSDFAVMPNGMKYSYTIPETNTIVLNPNQFDENLVFTSSTESKLHNIVHECIHCLQPASLSFLFKDLPQQYENTVDKLSSYASGNNLGEIHAELMTKKVLDKLTPDETELLKYFETLFTPKLDNFI